VQLSAKESLDAFQSQNSSTDRLWAYFSAVSLAVAGYAISNIDTITTARVLAISGAYAVFCINNNLALGAAQTLLISLAQITRDTGSANGVSIDIRVLSCRTVRLGQGLMAAAVIIGIFSFSPLLSN